MEDTKREDDPIVAEIIEESLRPSIGRVSNEVLEDMRLVLLLFLTTHPEAVAAVDSLRPRLAVSASGDMPRGPLAAEEPVAVQQLGGLRRLR
jgi:hypothetical protein